MRGSFYFKIHNKRLSYNIVLQRSITIIKGDSGTGKTVMLNMISDYIDQGRNSGVHISTNASSFRVLKNSTEWVSDLKSHENTIYFADEDVSYIITKAFADLLFKTGSYLVFISRSGRTGYLSYSISDIYYFKCKKANDKYANSLYHTVYTFNNEFKPDLILTEDSTSGKDIISHAVNYKVESAFGKDNIINRLEEFANNYNNIYIIVDGAAYGNQIASLLSKIEELPNNVAIFAPESFEYLLLNTSLFKKFCKDELINTSDYVESSVYGTWENYFESLLKKLCSNYNGVVYYKTNWSSLNKFFKQPVILDEVRNQLQGLHK